MNEELKSVCLSLKAMEEDPELRLGRLFNALSLIHSTLGEGSWVGIYVKKGDKWLLAHSKEPPLARRSALAKGLSEVAAKGGERRRQRCR